MLSALIECDKERIVEKLVLLHMNGDYVGGEWAEYDDKHFVIYLTKGDYFDDRDSLTYINDKRKANRELNIFTNN